MKIKNEFIAMALKKLGVEVKAELSVDDVNGETLVFPEISEMSEIAVGVAVNAPEDGTYKVANAEETIVIVVIGGIVDSVTVAEEEASDEMEALIETLVEASVKQRTQIEALQTDLTTLKASLKHEAPKAKPEAGKDGSKFKII